MNVGQQALYSGCWNEKTTPRRRVYSCSFCYFNAQARAGKGSGNALATVSKLRGRMMTHVRERHPERIGGVSNG